MRIRVGHLDYTVRPYAEADAGYTENFGVTQTGPQVILVSNEVSPARQLEVLLHELLHASWDALGKLHSDRVTEEQAINFAGAAMAALILNNPHLLPVLSALAAGATFQEDPNGC